MKTVKILETFDGFPNGKTLQRFAEGEEVTVSNTFADLIVGKGHAKLISEDSKAEPEPEVEQAEPEPAATEEHDK